ncbi:shikimate dehydrogenase [Pseudidiomarina terrestris]|uniref:shikimate dehydrogenase n=1 Tax=Pseudidiomarina terrestris TaxID=2820060 RepID=UPI0026507462|nr:MULTISPECIES: shikimate dehydrogenase [unclassified Pseudidiomarina]MDN7135675.1 shikimate dehydrogenase [Pseudidiomarina sp. 1ASP75-5]MDN7137287.1 shikimate dehydrogenase [Pseudidiomarina sp. 1ASP75-14]MEA3588580.1 shikimate dehydrogenase [Pseudidiomarina sp. 1APP75-27a]
MTQFTVFGNPIAHSVSPKIHQLFAEQFGLALTYSRSLSSSATFAAAVAKFFRHGGAGANVTVPFKESAAALVTHLTPRAERAASVNTLIPLGLGQLAGDTTDGLGLCRDLQRLTQQKTPAARVLVIGGGGAARSVIEPLQELGCEVVISNRSRDRVQPLTTVFEGLEILDFAELERPPTDVFKGSQWLVINATSASLQGAELPIHPHWFANANLVYDMMYAAQTTPFLQQARKGGAVQVADGLGMLVEQAALSFALWHDGLQPSTEPVLDALRKGLR